MKIYRKLKQLAELLLLYTSMLSIRSKKIYVFGAWQGKKFADNSKYLFLQAINDKSIKAVWITKSRKIYEYMKSKGYPVYLHKSLGGIYYQLRASVYFTSERKNDVSALLIGNATRINLWHGVGLKKILADVKPQYKRQPKKMQSRLWNLVQHYPYRKEYVLSTSDTMTKIFSSAFKKPQNRLLQMGQPRNDVFFDDNLETDALPFIPTGKKMVLYMPTHRQQGKTKVQLDKIFDLNKLNEICQRHQVVFVVKKHFYHRSETESLTGYDNIVDISATEYDAQLLLKKAAILITDYSSCYVDYLLLDKPVIFYNFDIESYILNDRDLYFEYDKTTPGPKVDNFLGLARHLEDYLAEQKDPFRLDRERIKNLFYSQDNQQEVGKKILTFVKEKLH